MTGPGSGTYTLHTPEAAVRVTYANELALALREAHVERYVPTTPEMPGRWVTVDTKSELAIDAQDRALRAHNAAHLAEMLVATIWRARAILRERGAPDCEALRKATIDVLTEALDEIDRCVAKTRSMANRDV